MTNRPAKLNASNSIPPAQAKRLHLLKRPTNHLESAPSEDVTVCCISLSSRSVVIAVQTWAGSGYGSRLRHSTHRIRCPPTVRDSLAARDPALNAAIWLLVICSDVFIFVSILRVSPEPHAWLS